MRSGSKKQKNIYKNMFKSQAQRAFMYARHPELAKEFESKTPKGKKLPEKVRKRSSQIAAIKKKMQT